MFGGSGNYASALYIAAAKVKSLDKVESELIDFVNATSKASTFSQFMKDLAVPAVTRVKAVTEICTQAKFSDVTKNFLGTFINQHHKYYFNVCICNIGSINSDYWQLFWLIMGGSDMLTPLPKGFQI